MLLMLNGGGRSLEDIREIRADHDLREILSMERIPSSDATGDWLRRIFTNDGLEALAAVNLRMRILGVHYLLQNHEN